MLANEKMKPTENVRATFGLKPNPQMRANDPMKPTAYLRATFEMQPIRSLRGL